MTSTYILLAFFLAFAVWFALNAAATATGVGVWYLLASFTEKWSAKKRANLIFALRFFPLLGSLIFVLALLLPAYLLYEPYDAEETITFKLALPALLAICGAAFALYRVGGSFWRTRRLVNDWLADAEPIRVAGVNAPVYRITHPFPLIAVVGVFAPKVFVARQIFHSLDEREFQAAVRHECGHLIARDNLKRMLLGVCRDLLIFPFARRLDKLWARNSESAADEYAVQTGDDATALDLAAAIVKISRIAPENVYPTTLAGASMLTEQTGDIAWRVRRLVRLSEIRFFQGNFSRFGFWIQISLFCFSTIGLIIINHQFLEEIHSMMERIVRIIQ